MNAVTYDKKASIKMKGMNILNGWVRICFVFLFARFYAFQKEGSQFVNICVRACVCAAITNFFTINLTKFKISLFHK